MMNVVTLPVTGYWVICDEDNDYNKKFGSSDSQFYRAAAYMKEKRKERPDLTFKMLANIYE